MAKKTTKKTAKKTAKKASSSAALTVPTYVTFQAGATTLDKNNALGIALQGAQAQTDVSLITLEATRWRLE